MLTASWWIRQATCLICGPDSKLTDCNPHESFGVADADGSSAGDQIRMRGAPPEFFWQEDVVPWVDLHQVVDLSHSRACTT